jgi:serine/threonine protein phosphatase PrpC
VNQDAAFTASWGAAVADGVGGGPAGDLASAAFVHRLAAGRVGALEPEALATSVRAANWDLRAHVERDATLSGMATTFTGLFVSSAGDLLLAHTGDSRAYRLRDAALVQQSRDDSLVQALLEQGLVSVEDALAHPHRNIITASLGGRERDAASVDAHEARIGDRWMLCSDGLTDYVPEAEIHAMLAWHADPAEAARACVELALAAGTHDNVTVVVCDVLAASAADAGETAGTAFYGSAAARFMEGL